MKRCSKCKRELEETEFFKHSQHKDGLSSWCKNCELARNAMRRGMPVCSRRSRGKAELCPRCFTNPRGNQPYCPKCKLDYQNETRSKKWAERYSGNEAKRIETARAYATNLLARGKIRRGPCVFCDDAGTQFHHYDYERMTRNFEDVCDLCHSKVHRFLQFVVDSFRFHGVKVV